MPVSNGSFANVDCSDISGWTDGDTGGAVSEQITFDGKSTFKFDTNASAAGNYKASRNKDFGSAEAIGDRITLSISLYCDAVGTELNDGFDCQIRRSDWILIVRFAASGIYLHDGTDFNEVGTDLVAQDQWQEWTFDVDLSAGVANAVCDVYLDNVLQASDVDCSWTGSVTDGQVYLVQYGYTTDDRISYVDWLKIGDGFAASETTALQDMKTDIELAGWGRADAKTDIHAAGWGYAHTVLDLSAYYQKLENAQLDISVQVWTLSNLVLDVRLTDGIMLIDTILDLAAYYQKLEDAKLDIEAWGDKAQDARFDGIVAAWARKDQKIDMFAGVDVVESISMSVISAREVSNINAMLDMDLTDGASLQDGMLDIEITDAVLLHDAGLDLAVIEIAPTFRAVYAMHLDSVITEI